MVDSDQTGTKTTTMSIVAIEQGSLSHNDPVLRFDPDARGMLTFTGLRIAAPETVCREASALLEGGESARVAIVNSSNSKD